MGYNSYQIFISQEYGLFAFSYSLSVCLTQAANCMSGRTFPNLLSNTLNASDPSISPVIVMSQVLRTPLPPSLKASGSPFMDSFSFPDIDSLTPM
ncbi:hypothetical protein STEG23_030616 [Scotinomys teguina]